MRPRPMQSLLKASSTSSCTLCGPFRFEVLGIRMFQRAAAQLPGKGFYMDVATTSAFTIVVNQITTGLGATGSGPSRLAIDTGCLSLFLFEEALGFQPLAYWAF